MESLSQTISFNIMFNIILGTDTLQHIMGMGMGLSIPNRNNESNRNNTVAKLLSAPNSGSYITSRQCLRCDTAIVKSAMDNMSVNGNVYIPPSQKMFNYVSPW